MKTIPENLPMVAKMYADGAKGSAVQLLANDEFDVICIASRKDRFSEFTQQWVSAVTGTIQFPSWSLLRAAMLDDYRDYELMASAEYRKYLHGYSIVSQVMASAIYVDQDLIIVGDLSPLFRGFG